MTLALVSGGAGFIGSNLVDGLLEQGLSVRVLDNFSSGRRENVAHCLDHIELIEGDLVEMDVVRRAMQGVEIVFHQAAMPSVPRSIKDPLASNLNNVQATLHVLVAARDAGVARVVYASSSSVYGDQAEDQAKVESMAARPISPYGAAKLAAEVYCQVFYRAYGLETVALRYFNVFGPRQDPASQYAAVVPRFITAMLDGDSPTIYGDGEQTRDFTFVGDTVVANLLAASAEAAPGGVFNIARHEQHSVNELVAVLNELLGLTIEPEYSDPRAGDIRHSLADVAAAREVLAYDPQTSFAEGLRRTVDWFGAGGGRNT